jgi:hypothetical protein
MLFYPNIVTIRPVIFSKKFNLLTANALNDSYALP